MQTRRFVLTALAVWGLFACPAAWAGKYNPTLNIGAAAPNWEKLPGTDGKEHSLNDFKDREVVVIAFTCGSCPTAVDYEGRMKALAKKLEANGKGVLIAINANDTSKAPEDTLEAMQERAQAKAFNYLYLRDDKQAVAKAYGATTTPEFFVLNKERKIVYMGALDDKTDAAAVSEKYVEAAIDAALADKSPAVAETVARGCLVRYAKERRKKE
jgi:peroxiredoxin